VPTRVVSIRLKEDTLLRIKQLASRERKTVTAVIEESVDAALGARAEDVSANAERLSYVVGCCAGGGGDVTKMDLGETLTERHAEDVRA
jgi:predicted DNA-binding protein